MSKRFYININIILNQSIRHIFINNSNCNQISYNVFQSLILSCVHNGSFHTWSTTTTQLRYLHYCDRELLNDILFIIVYLVLISTVLHSLSLFNLCFAKKNLIIFFTYSNYQYIIFYYLSFLFSSLLLVIFPFLLPLFMRLNYISRLWTTKTN